MLRRRVRGWVRQGRGIGPGLFALLVVLALAAPSAARLAGPDGPAWFPAHGHILRTASAAVHDHAHPWDEHHDESPGAGSAAAEGDVLFTLGDLSVASALAMIALPVLPLLAAVAWWSQPLVLAVGSPAGTRWRPLVPPPQR